MFEGPVHIFLCRPLIAILLHEIYFPQMFLLSITMHSGTIIFDETLNAIVYVKCMSMQL